METDCSNSNQFYFPSVIEYIITYYTPILPLWSNLLFDSLENDPLIRTNAVVENWKRILKRTIMKSATKLRPGDFIRNLYPNLSGRVSAFSLGFIPIANKLNEGIYLMLQGNHYSPILEIKYNQSPDTCIYFDNGSKLDTS